jgi:hypothetical protein
VSAMSIQEDAVWPPEKVPTEDLDQTDLAVQQRENVEDPVQEQWAGIGEQTGESRSGKRASRKGDSDS